MKLAMAPGSRASPQAVAWLVIAASVVLLSVSGCAPARRGPCVCRDSDGAPVDMMCGETQCIAGTEYVCGADGLVQASGACGVPANPRPADAPDFVIIAASGHCLSVTCPEYNAKYLGRDGTIDEIQNVILSHGRSVAVGAYSDSFHDWVDTGTGETLAFGFRSMLADLRHVRDDWIGSFDNPTRVIVLAHSHGAVWAHLALLVLEAEGRPLPVDILVDLDGISIGWESDAGTAFVGDAWWNVIVDWSNANSVTWPIAIWDAADAFAIPGQSTLLDAEDVVPGSVLVNLEVWSDDGLGVRDTQPNWREDGTQEDIYQVQSMGENHSEVTTPGSNAMNWVVESIDGAYAW